jgi:hypothetical protein
MAKSQRIARDLPERLSALDDHQYLLRQHLHGLSEDKAHVKVLASELRALACHSSNTEGLLWRLADTLSVSDEIELFCGRSVNRNHPLAVGMVLGTVPVHRAEDCPPNAPPPEMHRLRDVIKEDEAIYLPEIKHQILTGTPPDIKGLIFTHELLIKAVAEQMGGAHEDDGLEYRLACLQQVLVNQTELYVPILAYDADLVLQIVERVLDSAAAQCGFQRKDRRGQGDMSISIRLASKQRLVGILPIASFSFPVSEVRVTCSAAPTSVRFTLEKRGEVVGVLDAAYPPEWEHKNDAVFTILYSSDEKQACVLTNDRVTFEPVGCDLGYLDGREFRAPKLNNAASAFIAARNALIYSRCLTEDDCRELLRRSGDSRTWGRSSILTP